MVLAQIFPIDRQCLHSIEKLTSVSFCHNLLSDTIFHDNSAHLSMVATLKLPFHSRKVIVNGLLFYHLMHLEVSRVVYPYNPIDLPNQTENLMSSIRPTTPKKATENMISMTVKTLIKSSILTPLY